MTTQAPGGHAPSEQLQVSTDQPTARRPPQQSVNVALQALQQQDSAHCCTKVASSGSGKFT